MSYENVRIGYETGNRRKIEPSNNRRPLWKWLAHTADQLMIGWPFEQCYGYPFRLNTVDDRGKKDRRHAFVSTSAPNVNQNQREIGLKAVLLETGHSIIKLRLWQV